MDKFIKLADRPVTCCYIQCCWSCETISIRVV